MKYYDISPTISDKTAVFPGDTAFSRQIDLDMQQGDNLTLSSFQSTCHIGAHADAPSHYDRNGVSIDQRALDYYLGTCQVISTPKKPEPFRLYTSDISQHTIIATRVLFRTQSYLDPNQWHDTFTALSPELIDDLATQGVRLVGIDTPSIDPANAKQLISHAAIAKQDMAILEGLLLNDVPDGLYQLIALPLKIESADAAPVRAILIPLEEN